MRILWLAFLYITATPAQGYGGSWLDLPSPEVPSFQRPVDVVTDVINELGVRILQEYGETGHGGNVAFSPTGIGFVLAALYEGSKGPGNEQIAHVLGLPRDKDVTRIGLRDIHRRLRSYLSPDGFLGGLTLNKENTKLRPEYENILKFLGFDFPSADSGTNVTDSSTSLPETTSEIMTTPSSSSPTSTETTESPATLTTPSQASTASLTTVTSRITDEVTTTTLAPEEVTAASTNAPKDATTMKSDGDNVKDATTTMAMITQEISEPPSTNKVVEATEELSTTVEVLSTQQTTIPTTPQSPTTVQVSSRLTEASSTVLPVEEITEPISSTQPTTVGIMSDAPSTVTEKLEAETVKETTLASVDDVLEPTKIETTTLLSKDTVSSEITTERATTVSSEEEKPSVEVSGESESQLETEESTSNSGEGEEELVTSTTEESLTLETKETSLNEIVYDSTTIRIDTTTVDEVDEVETIANMNSTSSESETLFSMENKNVTDQVTTTSTSVGIEPLERRRVRRIGIRDPVVRTLLDARSANPKVKVNASSDFVNSKESGVVWINRVVEYSFTEQNDRDSTTLRTILKESLQDDENEDHAESISTGAEIKNRGTRNARSYFSNFPEFPTIPIYSDFPGLPEETSWTRKVGGWRVHSPKIDEASRDSTELTFLVNGEDAAVVSAATYTVVLPFAFLPSLQALALEFPLDDPRYNILLLLPTDRDGTRRLARDLGNVGLRELRKELQPAWVRAMIPSFMLKGFVTLTPFLQRLGIRDVFEPRDADLSPMTDDVGVYARDVQQSIGVNIRNYMKPDRTHSRNGLFERAGPVSFVAEHPFLFFIIDAETGVSLIAGRIEDPLNSRIL